MSVTGQIKILIRKIVPNEAQYDLDRKAAKLSALSSNNLDKYEYLTSEDLGLKPSNVERAKFEYSPLGKILNKGLDKDDQKEELKKNIEGKNEEHFQAIKFRGEKKPRQLKNIGKNKTLEVIDEISRKNKQANKSVPKCRKIDRTLDKAELVCTKTNGTKYDFNRYPLPLKCFEKVHYYEIQSRAIKDQVELEVLINNLHRDYNPRSLKK